MRAISALTRPAASMARISARLNNRIGQYRLPPARADGRPRSLECAIPDPLASPIKKAPINQWEHRYLGEERFPETLSALEIEHPAIILTRWSAGLRRSVISTSICAAF